LQATAEAPHKRQKQHHHPAQQRRRQPSQQQPSKQGQQQLAKQQPPKEQQQQLVKRPQLRPPQRVLPVERRHARPSSNGITTTSKATKFNELLAVEGVASGAVSGAACHNAFMADMRTAKEMARKLKLKKVTIIIMTIVDSIMSGH
jgi:hypothetical protein